MNRESWLGEAISTMRPWFEEKKFPLPEVILASCGWPQHKGGKTKAFGQCFDPVWTKDGVAQIFICPTIEDPVRVLDVLLHELCHTAVGTMVGHSGPFVTLIRAFGLEGKATTTYCKKSSPLYLRLSCLSHNLGPYSHSAVINQKLASTRPPGGGWVKFKSKTLGSSYILRISPKSLAEHGAPLDPNGEQMEQCHGNV